MIVQLMLLALSQTPSIDTPVDRECYLTPSSVGLAPINVEPPAGLPLAIPDGDRILVPLKLAAELDRQSRCLRLWPQACQTTLDAKDTVCENAMFLERELTRRAVDQLSTSTQNAGWMTTAIVAGSAASLAFAAGVLLGISVSK